ncbi:MAG TPA: FAD-dependent oxidoreductase, partial [Candidatus Dormibacteraeota bacterium]|nr:FAD-dependent oxidoreductase [Candidatus Dormibacteraeota bacterium]
MGEQDRVVVVGAGVIGCAVALALARAGRSVLLLDPHEPGVGGASYGNVGHIAAELIEPLPSPGLLFGFWRQLFAFGGPLDIPWHRLGHVALWARRFAAAAFRRSANTRYLAPLVRPAAAAWERLLREVGAPQLLKRHGHCQVWFGPAAARATQAESQHMARLGIPTRPLEPALLHTLAAAAGRTEAHGLLFPESAHVLDPRSVCTVLAQAAAAAGATLERTRVRGLASCGARIEVHTAGETLNAAAAVVCAGVWSEPLLVPFGLRAPLEPVRGYHVELPQHPALVDAPLIYMNDSILVTPMAGRLRASSYMEFERPDAAADPRKPKRLRHKLRQLGYACEADGESWVGTRPVLPDYLPGIGRAPGAPLYYAIGHQHLGLT